MRELREAAERLATTNDEPLAALERMTVAEMRSDIERLSREPERLGNAATQKFNRHRAEIAAAYGAFEIGALLQNVFRLH